MAELAAVDGVGPARRVVLVSFWTYTCINWLRSQPYLRAWAERYAEDGLVVVGVHTPEFDFERDLANVRRAVEDLRVDYPVAVDTDYAIWDGFANRYWPALYLVDPHGRIRHHRFGEGGEERSERAIQQLLAEAGARGIGQEPSAVEAVGLEAAADWDSLASPRTISAMCGPRTSFPRRRGAGRAPRLRRIRPACAGTTGHSPATGRSGARRRS